LKLLQDKVVLVTGGAGGIGRECALLAARQGARVVVNDLGGSLKGDDVGSAAAAQKTVSDIREEGGDAVANEKNVASLEAARDMVRTAIEKYGSLDAVINPAGILRDSIFHKMSEQDWDAVISVHLRGAFNVSRAAVEYFRSRNAGSFVHFTSTSGLIGNIGQANYAAAKMGVVGLSRILAMEGVSRGIRSNVIAPFAFTRMIESIPATDDAARERKERIRLGMRADQVAQLAIALAADEAANVSGQIFGVRGNEVILFNQPRPLASVIEALGWTANSLLSHGLPALRHKFTDLGASASVFPYDPV
jgi:NAD(P)-dependent dehydrogenase (short-subunit alcohol dehydrogenase family)